MAHSDDSVAESGKQSEKITIAFLILAWVFVLLRIWTRTHVISNFGWDDTTMILACLIFSVYSAALLYMEANGGGTHVTSVLQLQLLTKVNLSPNNSIYAANHLQWVVISEATYVIAMMMLKISLGIFFARIVIKPWQIGLIYVNVGINIFSSAAAFFYVLFRCGANIDNYVLQQVANRCAPRTLDRFIAYQQAAITTLTDIVFVTLPVLILWNANMSRRSKISVGFILCLATLGVVCSALRFRYVDGLTDTADFFWAAVNISKWSTIECGASIIAGCLATLRPFIRRVFVNARSSTLGSYVKQASRSLRSSERSNMSSLPRHNSASTAAKTGGSRDKQSIRHAHEPTLMEFLAHPGEEVIPMSDRPAHVRESEERILQQPGVDGIDFPWPAKSHERRNRRTIHASWTLRNGVASDGRTTDRPTAT